MKKYSKKWMQTFVEGKFPEDAKIVEEVSKRAFEVEDVEVVKGTDGSEDSLFEIKVLPNRVSDAFCIRGMAREFATVFDLKPADLYKTEMFNDISTIERKDDFVEIQNQENNFATKCYFGISIEIDKQIETPTWIKDIIEKSGGRSINSLVDLTNLMLYSFGQPTHVFDLEKLKGKIITRTAKKGEKITLLDGKVLELLGFENLICDEKSILALAGIKGGKEAEVDGNTTKAYFEIANFEADAVRLASLKQNIRTDASKIYENSLSINTTEEVLIILTNTIKEVYPQAKINFISKQYADSQFENLGLENKNNKITFTTADVNKTAGIEISKDEILKILNQLGFEILEQSNDTFTIQAHKDRLDINIKEDLLEEILRVYGFDNIPSVPLKVENNFFSHNTRFLFENFLKNFLVKSGLTEVYNYTFVEKGDLKVLLPLSEDKSYLRNNMLEGGLKAYQKNYNFLPILETTAVGFFEIGSVFLSDTEDRRMLICLEDGKKKSKNLETIETIISKIESELGISKIEFITKNEKPAMVEFSIDKIVTELETNNITVPFITSTKSLNSISYKPISIYPFIVRDVATFLPESLENNFDFENLKKEIVSLGMQNVEKIYMFDKFTKQQEDGKTQTSIAFRIIFQSYEKTLADTDVESEMAKLNTYLQNNGYVVR